MRTITLTFLPVYPNGKIVRREKRFTVCGSLTFLLLQLRENRNEGVFEVFMHSNRMFEVWPVA